MANNAACMLLGYSEKELLLKSLSYIFNTKEINFKKMAKQKATAGRSAVRVVARKKGGKSFPSEIDTAIFIDESGIQNSIVTITDLSQRIRKQLTIDIKKEKIVAADIAIAKSKQKKIDVKKEKKVATNIVIAKSKQKKIDVKKEEITAANTITARISQKNIDAKNKKTVANNIFIAKSKQKKVDEKKDKIVAANIILARSKQKKIDTRKDKIVSDNIILAKSKSDKAKLVYENSGRTKLLTEMEESFRIMFNSSSDVLLDSDLLTGKIMVNDAYEKEFGYIRKRKATSIKYWATHIHPADKETVMRDYYRVLKSAATEWKCAYRFLRADHSVANIYSSRVILRNPDGKAYRMIGSMQDMSKQKVLEERLEQEIKLKEKQIAEAAEDAKDAERSDIGKELHDNVNQLLGVSKLYLDMAKRGGENSEMYLSRSSEYTLMQLKRSGN